MKRKIFKALAKAFRKNNTKIMIGASVIAGTAAVAEAIYVTPKAVKSIEERKKELEVEKLTVKETIKTTWRYYAPVAVTMIFSAGCAIGAESINLKRNATLTAAYSMSETVLRNTIDETAKEIGEEKAEDIHRKARNSAAASHANDKAVYDTGFGEMIFLETITGRKFRSSYRTINAAVAELNRSMNIDIGGCVTYNDLATEIGLPPLDPLGEEIGWSLDIGLIDPEFDSILDENGVAIPTISFRKPPRMLY